MDFDSDIEPTLDDFKKMFEVGIYQDRPACRIIPFETDISPVMIAGMLTAMVDATIESIEENKQIEFETSVLTVFEDMVKSRFEYINKYKLDKDES
jgi:hypothetical protein